MNKKFLFKSFAKIISFLLIVATMNVFILSSFVMADFSKTEATNIYNATKIDQITSKSYAIGNADANQVMQVGGDTANKYHVGNITKLMTLYLAYEAIEKGTLTMETQLTTSVEAQLIADGRSRVFLDGYRKEKITVKQAIEAICIASANDAAYVLAEGIGETEENFVLLMNNKAAELGMKNTSYKDSTGINTEQYTTAEDLAILACDFINKYPSILDFTKLTYGKFQHNSTGLGETEMVSGNNLTRGKFYTQSDGLLVGYSQEDGYSMVATVADGGTRSVAVVVGATDENYRAAEIKKLLEYGISDFEYRKIESAGTFVRKISIKDGENKKISTETVEDLSVLLNVKDFEKVQKKVNVNKKVTAPAKKGEVVGEIVYYLEDEEIGKVDIALSEDMEKAGWFTLLIRKILAFFGLE